MKIKTNNKPKKKKRKEGKKRVSNELSTGDENLDFAVPESDDSLVIAFLKRMSANAREVMKNIVVRKER